MWSNQSNHKSPDTDTGYAIPKTGSRDDSGSRMIKRKTIQDMNKEFPLYPDPVYRPPPKAAEIPLQEVPRNLSDLDMDINADFKENSPYQEGVILATYQDLIGHISRNHQNWMV